MLPRKSTTSSRTERLFICDWNCTYHNFLPDSYNYVRKIESRARSPKTVIPILTKPSCTVEENRRCVCV